MQMRPLSIWLRAFLRRLAAVAGSAIITFVIANWAGWVRESLGDDPRVLQLWPLVLLIIEAIQKAIRVGRSG